MSMDSWDGYPASRDRVVRSWVDAGVRNPVVLTGDVHAHWASDVLADWTRRLSPVLGSEFVARSITSGGDGYDKADGTHPWAAQNPNLQLLDQPARLRQHHDHTDLVHRRLPLPAAGVGAGGAGLHARSFVVDDGVRGMRQVADNPLPTARADRSLRAPRSDAAIIADTIEAETGH